MSSRDTPKTIILKGDGVAKEGIAVDTIKPGMLLEISSGVTGLPNKTYVATHNSSSARKGGLRVAREMELTGGTIDDEYEAGDIVLFTVLKPGSEFFGLLAAGSGNDVVAGDELMSNADGTLAKKTSTNAVVAIALQHVDNDPGTGGAAVRIKAEAV